MDIRLTDVATLFQHISTWNQRWVFAGVYRGELVGAVFINLSKTFHTIGHEILLSKLPSHVIRNTELTWFTDYLFSRKQLVNFDKCSSKKESVLCGVPQGSILGPLLFMFQRYVSTISTPA